jgi:hypothetical protein
MPHIASGLFAQLAIRRQVCRLVGNLAIIRTYGNPKFTVS